MNVPDSVGVPLIVIVLDAQVAVTPAGRPIAEPIPVALVVEWVIAVSAVLIQIVGEAEASPAKTACETVIVPVADPVPQPPNRGML